jgi:hypothetical protein
MKHVLEFETFNEDISGLFKSAANQIALENPEGSNKGDKVERMQKLAGTTPGQPWCAAYVYSVFHDANLPEEVLDEIPRTPSVKQLWDKSDDSLKITRDQALRNPSLIKPGMVFCYLTKNSKGAHGPAGHTGIVTSVDTAKKMWTGMEGNSNPVDGSREGYGTFLISRSISDPSISSEAKEHPALLLGFIDYLKDHRKGPEYKKFLANVSAAARKYWDFTKKEISRIKSNPKLASIHAMNFKNRFKG